MRASASGVYKPDTPSFRSNAILASLAFASIVVSMMQTLIIPLIPHLPQFLNTVPYAANWAVTATLLSASVASPIAGRLGDMFGKRRVLLASLLLLVAGSFTVAISQTLAPAIAGRILQGLAAGSVPLGMSILRDEFPPERLAGSAALISASLGIGSALGLPAAAFVAGVADWHVLFFVSGLLGTAAWFFVWHFVPTSSTASGGRFDWIGAVGLSIALVCSLLAISRGAEWGWSSIHILGLFGAAAFALVLWCHFELRINQPLIDLRLMAQPRVLLTNMASMAVGFAMFVVSMIVPQLIQLPISTGYGMGGSLFMAGLVMAPQGLMMLLVSPTSGRLARARGPKFTLMLGSSIVAGGYVINILLVSDIWHQVLVSCVIGVGIGFAYGAMPALIMGSVPTSQTAAANSVNTLMRTLGSSFSSVVIGAILAHLVLPQAGNAVPTLSAFHIAMAIGAAAALTAFAIAFFLPGGTRHISAPTPSHELHRKED